MRAKSVEQWQLVIGCFIINLLYGAVGRLSSLFFVESIVYYGVDREMASLPYSLVFMVRGASGPLIGYIEQMVGMKRMIILGNLLGTISIGVCYLVEDIWIVTVFYGIFLGIAFSLGTQFLPLILNEYFSNSRNKINGITYAGACVGGILFPPLMKYCINNYSISGCFLILSALMAHSLPASLLLKNPEDKKRKLISENNNVQLQEELKSPLTSINIDVSKEKEVLKERFENGVVFTLYDPNNLEPKIVPNAERSAKKNVFTLKNFNIFIDPVFINMLITNACGSFAVTTIWTIILDFVRDKKVPVDLEIYYVMILPIADLIARLIIGFAIDKKIMTSSNLTAICFIGETMALVGMLFSNNYILLMFVTFMFPIFSGSLLILQIALIQEYIETSQKTMAMVCRTVLYVPLNLTTAPMIGYFRGMRGSYNGIFYILAGLSTFCGILTFFLPNLANRSKMTTKL